MKFLVGLLTVVVIGMAIGLAYFYGKLSGNRQETLFVPTPTITEVKTEAEKIPTPQPTNSVSYKKVKGGGILSFPKYELTVPADWEDSREVPGPDTERVILKKGKYELSILEGGFGGAACLYPGDADQEGPSGRYKYFVEIKTKSGELLRRSWNDGSGFGVCQKTQYGWGAPTLFGHVGIIVPDTYTSDVIQEIDEILTSITRI